MGFAIGPAGCAEDVGADYASDSDRNAKAHSDNAEQVTLGAPKPGGSFRSHPRAALYIVGRSQLVGIAETRDCEPYLLKNPVAVEKLAPGKMLRKTLRQDALQTTT
jgi:hypothetical protein